MLLSKPFHLLLTCLTMWSFLAADGTTAPPSQGGGTPATPPVKYAVTWLPKLGGFSNYAQGVNEAGTVVGSGYDADGILQACIWVDGQIQNLNHLVSSYCAEDTRVAELTRQFRLRSANKINSAGRIAGVCERIAKARDANGDEISDGEIGDRSIFVFDASLSPCLQIIQVSGVGFASANDLTGDGWILGRMDYLDSNIPFGFAWLPDSSSDGFVPPTNLVTLPTGQWSGLRAYPKSDLVMDRGFS